MDGSHHLIRRQACRALIAGAALTLVPYLAVAQPAAILALPDDALAYVPSRTATPRPLLVLLHGAGRQPGRMIDRLRGEAEARGLVLLAPASAGPTWDVVARTQREQMMGASAAGAGVRYAGSPDADRVMAAIAALSARVAIDRARIVLAGFSDGASFALALGLARERPFAAAIAWSPGLPAVPARIARGRRAFVAHGRDDAVLPFEATRSDIVPRLRRAGADIRFVEFAGGHAMPAEIVAAALDAAGLVRGAATAGPPPDP